MQLQEAALPFHLFCFKHDPRPVSSIRKLRAEEETGAAQFLAKDPGNEVNKPEAIQGSLRGLTKNIMKYALGLLHLGFFEQRPQRVLMLALRRINYRRSTDEEEGRS